jgi:hypothetical protein
MSRENVLGTILVLDSSQLINNPNRLAHLTHRDTFIAGPWIRFCEAALRGIQIMEDSKTTGKLPADLMAFTALDLANKIFESIDTDKNDPSNKAGILETTLQAMKAIASLQTPSEENIAVAKKLVDGLGNNLRLLEDESQDPHRKLLMPSAA